MQTQKQNRNHGFTLMELMVVVIILGILAATIIPKFIGTTSTAKVAVAQSHIAEFKSALERFNISMDRYPTTEEGLNALVVRPTGDENQKWKPILDAIPNDPWGHPYQYRSPGVRSRAGYDVWSRGSDNADGGEGEAADIGNW